ncbi:MAG: SEC-C metal-binding domain-containing protein [Acidobacteriota bacterium]
MNPEHEIELQALLRLLKGAVGEVLRRQDGDEFLSWMRSQAPERFPEIFSGLDERVARALALELGRQIWNATPLPRNDFQPLPLARPGREEPCPCGSGRRHGDCCADAPAVPGLTPELIGVLVAALIAEASPGGAASEEK